MRRYIDYTGATVRGRISFLEMKIDDVFTLNQSIHKIWNLETHIAFVYYENGLIR